MTRAGHTVTPRRCAFTLVEMIVAVAAVALLTVGIGQIYSSVIALTGSGIAIAETDQAARAMGAQLRNDFAALNKLRSDEAFFGIRNRRERVYLSPDDRDADRRAGIFDLEDPRSRSVLRRLDEMVFLGIGEYTSAQIPGNPSVQPVRAPAARIYYGHGLRPIPDTAFDPADPPSDSNVPRRFWIPDGDFGQPAGAPNRYDANLQVIGRNEFASQWVLLRHPLLLYGGQAAGPQFTSASSIIDPDLTYAPYPREYDNWTRFHAISRPGFIQSSLRNNDDPGTWIRSQTRADPRRLMWGRTDICAMSLERVILWLGGNQSVPQGAPRPPSAEPFTTGLLSAAGSGDSVNSVLWGLLRFGNPGDASQDLPNRITHNRGARSAIAGLFTRMLAETDPPLVDRRDALSEEQSGNIADPDPAVSPQSALMDLHAVLASRCSHFEIAWSDGSTWLLDDPLEVDTDGDGQIDIVYRRGDVIWFDIGFTRARRPDNNNFLTAQGRQRYYSPIALDDYSEIPPTLQSRRDLLFLQGQTNEPGTFDDARYDDSRTGERALINNGPDDPLGVREYLALFPSRKPSGRGDFTGPWPKPRLVRVRATLHDSQFRLREGKTYEWILSVDLK